jgi:hypothetical protein
MGTTTPWTFTATYNANGNPQWTFDGVGTNHHLIKVGEANMSVVVNLAGSGVALYNPPAGGALYGQTSMLYIEGQSQQPSWMQSLTRNNSTQFSFTDTDAESGWGKYHFLIGYTVSGNPTTQYTPDPTIMNLDPSGSDAHPHAHEAARA